MQELFSLEDIFNIMIELESLGNKHYIKMQELTNDYKLKELFAHLAKEENAHKELYTKYKNTKITFEANKANEEYCQYMDSLLNGTVRFLEASREIKDFNHGFSIAVNLEKDTILFLGELRRVIDSSYFDAIDNIMDQERNHLKALYDYVGA